MYSETCLAAPVPWKMILFRETCWNFTFLVINFSFERRPWWETSFCVADGVIMIYCTIRTEYHVKKSHESGVLKWGGYPHMKREQDHYQSSCIVGVTKEFQSHFSQEPHRPASWYLAQSISIENYYCKTVSNFMHIYFLFDASSNIFDLEKFVSK